MPEAQDHDYQKRLRLDFKTEIVEDQKTGREFLVIKFDSDRYEFMGTDNNRLLYDKLDRWAIPLDSVSEMLSKALNHPLTGKGQYLGDAHKYIEDRRGKIAQILKGIQSPPYEFVDNSEEFLNSLPNGIHGFAILSLDIVGSTKLSNTIKPEENAKIISLILSELAQVAPFFHAQILKFTGDGILIYIPPPTFLTANDNAIDCAITMKHLIHQAINPCFQEINYPTVDIRIGIESGSAIALTIGDPSSKQHRDLIGETLNIACKIQTTALPGEIRLGQTAYQNIHTMWKKGCKLLSLPAEWPYTLSDGKPYPLYTFFAEGAIVDNLHDEIIDESHKTH